MPTIDEIDREIQRRQLIAELQGGPPAEPELTTEQKGQNVIDMMKGTAARDHTLEDETPGTFSQIAGSVARGAVGDIANRAGSAVAAAAQIAPDVLSGGTGPLFGEVYEDMLGTERMKEADFAESNPIEDSRARALGLGGGVGLTLATGPAQAVGSTLAKLGSRALAGTKSGAQATRGLASAMKRGAGKVASSTGKIGASTAKGAAVGAVISNDPVEGGKWGLGMGLLFNTPIGRAFLASQGAKFGGKKLSKAIYYGLHPSSRSKIMEAFNKFRGAK